MTCGASLYNLMKTLRYTNTWYRPVIFHFVIIKKKKCQYMYNLFTPYYIQ